MSTALTELKVVKVPCYTFHDGFSMYNNLLNGVLPVELKPIENTNHEILMRFVNATIGWVRYKPLLVYITDKANFEATNAYNGRISKIHYPKIMQTILKLKNSIKYLTEFEKYSKKVKKHFTDFENTKTTWS